MSAVRDNCVWVCLQAVTVLAAVASTHTQQHEQWAGTDTTRLSTMHRGRPLQPL